MNAAAIPFEIHITVGELSDLQSESFKGMCHEQAGKPLWIELARGDHRQQPMFSKVVRAGSLKEAVLLAEQDSIRMSEKGFEPKRLKIEVPLEYTAIFAVQQRVAQKRYYEWHGKVHYERVEGLLLLCETHGVHVSRNALKDDQHLRFLTLREFGTLDEFQSRVKTLMEDLHHEERVVSKQHFEYCVLDTNDYLDIGWLTS